MKIHENHDFRSQNTSPKEIFRDASRPLRAVVGHRKRPMEASWGRLRCSATALSGPEATQNIFFGKIYFRSEIMIFHDFHQFWRYFEDFATLASPSHSLLGSLSMVVTRAYPANEARIGRKITGKSSSFDLVWVL